MRKIKLLRATGIKGQGYPEGTVLDVDDTDAKTLIQMNKAEDVVEEEKPVEKPVEKKQASKKTASKKDEVA